MLKLNFKKSFSKIIFLIFIFSFIQIFIIKNNVSAYNVPTNGCSFSNATYTAYIISTSDLNGTLPLCFRDNDANNALTLKVGTGDSFDDASNKRIKKLSDGTGVVRPRRYLHFRRCRHPHNKLHKKFFRISNRRYNKLFFKR